MGYFGRYKRDAFTSNVFNGSKPDKKVKEVYGTITSLCHAWASENVLRGRCGASMFFEDGIMYSYGRHYEAAKIHTNKKGEKLVLINNDNYSVSTTNHLSEIKASVSHLKKLRVPSVSGNHEENIKYLEGTVLYLIELLFLHKPYAFVSDIRERLDDLDYYCGHFKLKHTVKISDKFREQLIELQTIASIKWNARQAKLSERRKNFDANLKIKHQAAIDELNKSFPLVFEQWKNGEITDNELYNKSRVRVIERVVFGNEKYRTFSVDLTDEQSSEIQAVLNTRYAQDLDAFRNGVSVDLSNRHWFFGRYYEIKGASEYAYLRVKDNKVETSRGADVPLSHALRLLDLIERGQAKKGERIGVFNFNSVSDINKEPVIVEIGCHKILLSEAQAVLAPYRMRLV
jgi:hypothetical protein